MSERSVLKEALVRARRNSRFRSLGRALLKVPVSGDILRQFTHRILPRGERVWFQVPTMRDHGTARIRHSAVNPSARPQSVA